MERNEHLVTINIRQMSNYVILKLKKINARQFNGYFCKIGYYQFQVGDTFDVVVQIEHIYIYITMKNIYDKN